MYVLVNVLERLAESRPCASASSSIDQYRRQSAPYKAPTSTVEGTSISLPSKSRELRRWIHTEARSGVSARNPLYQTTQLCLNAPGETLLGEHLDF